MSILSATELEPLQAARRIAEEHIETIRSIALARGRNIARNDDDDANRYHKVVEVVGALQVIYDAVSELEFEEEQPPEPPEPVVEEPEEDDPVDDDEDDEQDED